ncbi:MAG: TetR/AcrR family transcriptional regulator [Coriobacteriia bacterium]|nr:TetR/AcrR family transcriptional regulator [Coriobacteriia bacterium]MCL2750364.1 TetR/AcrR family transcriptional regulator [Coriobacteriia bacterium]
MKTTEPEPFSAKAQTKRDLERQLKKQHIYDKAIELFSTYGYAETTIADISKATGMSTGSIYHYYRNKEAILMQLGVQMSQVELLQNNREEKVKHPYDVIYEYLIGYAAAWENLGVGLTKYVYGLFDRVYLTEDLTYKNLLVYEHLTSYISLAQEHGTFDQSISARKACEYLFTFCRGLIFEWILFNGSFSLTEQAQSMLPRTLKTFIVE